MRPGTCRRQPRPSRCGICGGASWRGRSSTATASTPPLPPPAAGGLRMPTPRLASRGIPGQDGTRRPAMPRLRLRRQRRRRAAAGGCGPEAVATQRKRPREGWRWHWCWCPAGRRRGLSGRRAGAPRAVRVASLPRVMLCGDAGTRHCSDSSSPQFCPATPGNPAGAGRLPARSFGCGPRTTSRGLVGSAESEHGLWRRPCFRGCCSWPGQGRAALKRGHPPCRFGWRTDADFKLIYFGFCFRHFEYVFLNWGVAQLIYSS